MDSAAEAATLRMEMVNDLVKRRVIHSARVEAALRAVPRHLFAPWLTLAEAYDDQAWPIPEATPNAPATISQPTAVALMLEGFNLQPGQRVLEIGAGTGYNAALMAQLIGEAGRVTTIDIEAYLVEAAQKRLAEYKNIQVVHGDGGHGFPANAPYDRIVATVGAWDVPPAWNGQLALGGELIIPLHLGGEPQDHELIAFRRQGERLVGVGLCSLGMVLLRGEYAGRGRISPVQHGPNWHGALTTDLRVTVIPYDLPYQPQPDEKVIEKPSARLVLARRPTTIAGLIQRPS